MLLQDLWNIRIAILVFAISWRLSASFSCSNCFNRKESGSVAPVAKKSRCVEIRCLIVCSSMCFNLPGIWIFKFRFLFSKLCLVLEYF